MIACKCGNTIADRCAVDRIHELEIAAQEAHEKTSEMVAFICSIAERKICDEERDACRFNSGPYCGAHDWQFDDEHIIAARALLAKIDAAGSVNAALAADEPPRP